MQEIILLILGCMMLVGFAANLLFKKTKIPEILFLIIGGILIGPVFGIVNQEIVIAAAPIITALMLMIIMLDNGLSFDIFKVTRALPMTTIFSIGVMALTFAALTITFHFVFSFTLLTSAIIALILSGTTTDVITTLVSGMRVQKNAKQLLIFESVINDLQIIPFFILLHYAETSSISTAATINALLIQVPLTIVIAAIVALAWVRLIGAYLGRHPLNYIATLGMLFILYSATQLIGGNGPIAVLTFSLIFGNALNIFKRFNVRYKLRKKFTLKMLTQFKEIELDISFFIKTVFFVFLGIVFSFSALEAGYVLMAFILFAVIIVCRYVCVIALCKKQPSYKSSSSALVWICPRGYVAAVLAFAAIGSGIFTEDVVNIALLNIFLTTFIAIIYALYNNRNSKSWLR